MNEFFMTMWMKHCQQEGIKSTPIFPAIEPEILSPMEFKLDGTRITKLTEFEYKYQYSGDSLRNTIQDFVKNKTWPTSLAPKSSV